MGGVNGFGYTGWSTLSFSQITGLGGGYSYVAKAKSASKNKTPKKLRYNFKEISSQILRAKTSLSARVVVTRARGKVALLQRQVGTGTYDSKELDSAITHARAMERIARKRMKHLLTEEKASQKQKWNGSEIEWEDEENAGDAFSEENAGQEADEIDEISKEELARLMRELTREMSDLMMEMQESADELSGMDELSEEILGTVTQEEEPEELERKKKKHRSDEMKDIVEADMRYLRAMFDKLAREKAALTAGAKSAGGGGDAGSGGNAANGFSSRGVSLELAGVDMSTSVTALTVEPPPVTSEGAVVDVAV